MTRSEFIQHLTNVIPNVNTMLSCRISLPTITNHAAIELFMRGDVDSPDAIAIRAQLQSIDANGGFHFED
jgi:hypothetical protein